MTFTVSKLVSDETLDCIIHIESRGNPNAKAPTSSALGLFQFLNATWLAVVGQHRPDVLSATATPILLAMRRDPRFCIEMGACFTEDNLRAIGMNATGGDLYLAHFLGVGDARKFFRADPETPVGMLVKPEVIAANRSIMQDKTVAQVRAWAAKKMFEARGHGYIAKYFPPVAEPDPELEPAAAGQTADDYPDPQDAPAVPVPPRSAPHMPEPPTVVVPADAPPVVVEKRVEESAARDAETSPSWLKRQWKKVTGVGGGFLASIGGFAFDWRLMAVVMLSIAIAIGFIIWFMGPGNVREWIRKQVS